jgi:hypothetical protein
LFPLASTFKKTAQAIQKNSDVKTAVWLARKWMPERFVATGHGLACNGCLVAGPYLLQPETISFAE